jgi:hypothetical protein
MKRTVATLIAALFATAAFAQTPAPASTATATTTTTPAAAKADVKEAKADAKAAKADAKQQKTARHHPMVKHDATVASATPAPAAAK